MTKIEMLKEMLDNNHGVSHTTYEEETENWACAIRCGVVYHLSTKEEFLKWFNKDLLVDYSNIEVSTCYDGCVFYYEV